ncbi:mitochondrial distribution and morphology protein 10 [Rhizophagus irregularis]|uniref:Mitochondrial distribution and morphology protein 10 n=1 Tax=Rhizophagus irregularis TaxID=588596 RepID=A0A2I1H099_9GLOM|nr:mitochondrial distribution and morphology protein 10 [Rhizophagus irregularis]
MHDFMDYCLRTYFKTIGWNDDNQYSNLCSASRAILDFQTPRGLTFAISKIQFPLLKASYSMNISPILNGSLGYLFTSRPLKVDPSEHVNFIEMIDRFHINYVPKNYLHENFDNSDNSKIKDYLLYGRLFVPTGRLEAIYSRKFSQWMQCVVTAVSDPRSKAASHVKYILQLLIPTFLKLQYDVGQWCTELSYTTDGELFGVRGLYNFTNYNQEEISTNSNNEESIVQNKMKKKSEDDEEVEALKGEWSIGAELYYGIRERSGGVSAGIRYRTLPQFSSQSPLSVTYLINPIMGHMSAAFAAQVSDDLALCPRFDFNMYSYESDLIIGAEWWQREKSDIECENQSNDDTVNKMVLQGEVNGIVKATVGTSRGVTLLWEGRYGKTLFSLGLIADLTSKISPIRSIGLQFQYFS